MKLFSNIILIFLLSFSWPEEVQSEKILVVAFFSSKSHKLTYMPLIEELGKRGHNVTVLTPIKATKQLKNVHEHLLLDWDEVEKGLLKDGFSPFEMKEKNENMNPFTMLGLFDKICRDSYDLPIIKQILEDDFDLIFMKPMFNDCVLGLVHRLKAPLILFSPLTYSMVGGHLPPSFIPNLFFGYQEEMNFYQRFVNFGFNVMFEGILRFYYEPAMAAIYREKLGQDIPAVHEILGTTSLILTNQHFTIHRPKPLLPNVIEVAGIHSFHEAKPLPKEIEDFVQKGKNGFIYFSMGSVIKGSEMPEYKRKMFLNVFAKLKQQVLWKWETETMPDLPKNVKLSKWLPQQDILGHKDIKMFITHCGGGSTDESIYNGVPLIGFPMFGDQLVNAKLAGGHGMIVELDWNTVTEEKLMNAIQDILNKPQYQENAKRLSVLYKDQPDEPLKRAAYWVEYVLRHKGAPHLRSAGTKLNWFQYHSYDVILTYFGAICLVLYLFFAMLRWIFRKIRCRSSASSKKSKRE